MKIFFIQLMFGLTILFNSSLTQAQTVTTFAGSGIQGNTDGTGMAAQFSNPMGICKDAAGNLYVADTGNSRIRKITPEGQVTTLAGSGTYGNADGTGTAAQFNRPTGITVDNAGNLYVVDSASGRIRKITPQGQVSTLAGNYYGYAEGTGTAALFNRPEGIAVDTAGNLYVADMDNNRIRKITPQGQVTTLAGGTHGSADGPGTTAQFINPHAITIDTAGNLYLTDSGYARIRKITPQGLVTTLAGSTQGYADGVGTAAQFFSPTGITSDTNGNIYVADTYNYRIRKITSQGQVTVTTLAGSTQGYADGIGTAALFNEPGGIIVGNDGNLYIADTRNNRIRKITLQVLGTTETDKAAKVKIYPNPAGDFITIDASPLKNASARLYDTSGKLIKSTPLKNSKNTLNVSELPKGAYIIEILSPEGNTSQKLIKK
ncbi:T9SS type A sorting domain-containing protein [Chryseobacterium sp. PMSZPI]|uniref:T9SS type A sorting domain-containing protein n=1 Tax=Chryseobacterium sp. PMSZPI TaxID=1033900 RepID=UPI0039A33A66